MLLQIPDGNLAVFMQRLLSAYARYFNRTHRQAGHLFQMGMVPVMTDDKVALSSAGN